MKTMLLLSSFLILGLFAQFAYAEDDLFTPLADTVALASQDNSSDRVALGVPSGWSSALTLRVVNDTDKTLFIKPGNSTVTAAAATDNPVLPGSDITFTINPVNTHVAAITASGTATGSIYFTLGRGK